MTAPSRAGLGVEQRLTIGSRFSGIGGGLNA